MDLQSWLLSAEMTHAEFATRIPCSRSTITHIATGRSNPSYRMAARIEELTQGRVPKSYWYPDKLTVSSDESS